MNTSKTTEQVIHGVRVVTTEIRTDCGIIRTYDGLLEAMAQPYRELSVEEARRRIHEQHRKILEENKDLVAHFVS